MAEKASRGFVKESGNELPHSKVTDRRCFLARGVLGAAGLGAAISIEENTLRAAIDDGNANPGQTADKPKTDIPPGSLACGEIGGVTLSRFMIGGNLIGGWAHSRDLMYASRLFTSYNTEAKIFETLELAQACGINAIQIDPKCWDPVLKYNKGRTEKLKTVVCIPLLGEKGPMNDEVKRNVDLGASLLYSHGGTTDSHLMSGGGADAIGQMLELIKAQGIPAGVGGHSLNVPMLCEKNNLNADFYLKTLHTDKYWSATPDEHRKDYDWMQASYDHNKNNDNMWCNNPEETAAFMESVKRPWIAFKVMAAGAISPTVAFPYAYRNGADFVVAGMFDFQVDADVKIAIKAIERSQKRKRAWYG